MDDDVSWVAIRQIRCDTLKVRHLSLVSADDNQAVPAGIRIWINQCWMDLPVTSRSLFCGAIVLLLLLVCSCSHSANEPILESKSVYQSVAPTREHIPFGVSIQGHFWYSCLHPLRKGMAFILQNWIISSVGI